MARIYKHKTHGWQIHYTLYFPDGTEKKKYKYYHNKLKAQDLLQDIEKIEYRSLKNTLSNEDIMFAERTSIITKDEANRLSPDRPIIVPTLGELKDIFLVASKLENRPSTHAVNEIRIQHLLDYFGKDGKADKITTDDVNAYRLHRLKSVTKTTINKEIIKLGQLLDIAVKDKALLINPARQIKRYKETKKRKPRSLSTDEIKALLGTAAVEKNLMAGIAYSIICTYLYTGMRRKELLWLEKEDVDLEKRRINIQAKLDFETKTGQSRTVGINPHLVRILMPFMKTEGRFVFGNHEPIMTPNSLGRGFKKIVNNAELPDTISLHSLRHTYITHLLEAGVNPRRVQELAGHRDFSTTWEYSHVLPSNETAEDRLNY
jgi:site-specific recombinase XerD